jgi:hypothetical protein
MEFIDKNGDICTIQDIEESILAITNFMKKDMIKVPSLAVYSLTIRRCLMEYLIIRKNAPAGFIEASANDSQQPKLNILESGSENIVV